MKKAVVSLLFFLMVLLPTGISAQKTDKYEKVITEAYQRDIVERLCSKEMEGRGSGTKGGNAAGDYILSRFRDLELKPFYYKEIQSFRHQGNIQMRNIMGVVPALEPSDDYIIVSAHYDHLGNIKGKVYPGADDNASGVAALLTVAEMFTEMRRDSVGPGVNILFIAFDGKEYSMAGSNNFVRNLPFAANQVLCEINLDILGSTLVPLHKNKPEYMIVLGRNTLSQKYWSTISSENYSKGLGLDLDYTFYGSDDFTKTMYKLGDHYPFHLKGIPALLFTSGFHEHTLKVSDTPEIINYPVLAKRTRLIFRTVNSIARMGR